MGKTKEISFDENGKITVIDITTKEPTVPVGVTILFYVIILASAVYGLSGLFE